MEKLKVDLHTHTSEDPKDPISYSAIQLIDRAHQLGFDALAITNHDLVTYDKELIHYAEKKDILLIPGMEATLSRKHVLFINPDFSENPPGNSIEDLPSMKSDNCLTIAPHPFFPQSKSLKRGFFQTYQPYFDAVEFSHCYTAWINFNKTAVDTANSHNIPMVGTSDCHTLWELGTTFTLIEARKDLLSIIEAVKEGKVEIEAHPLSNWRIFRVFLKALQMRAAHQFSRKID